MFIADLFAAVVFGVVIVFLLSLVFGTKGPWGSLLWFFIVVALFSWVGGVWLRPYGPVYMGVGWAPIILVGFFVAMLLTAVSPRNPRYTSKKRLNAAAEGRKASADVFFWVLILFLVMLAMSHYFWYPQFG